MTRKSVTVLAAACVLLAGLLSVGARAAGDPELQAAREELRLRVETERRMRGEFESLLADGRMSVAETTDFEDYLVRLGMTVEAQRRVVATLQKTGSQSAAGSLPNSPRAAPLPADFDRGQTDEEKIALLDAQLGSSLSEFDEKLLREQKELAEKSRSASTGESGENLERGDGASGQAGQAGNGQGENAEGKAGAESGDGAGESAAGSTGQDGESAQQAGAGEQGEASGEGAAGDDQVASAGGVSDAGRQAGKSATPPDIPDGKDDDIVARQLREAAENEQDPELREKLWEEYRKYKKRTP